MKKILIFIILLSIVNVNFAQTDNFRYSVAVTPVTIPGLPGIHSFVIAHYHGKWLIIGGRKDGSHAKQPFRAFPFDENNRDIFVVDVYNNKFWRSTASDLNTELKEQLQSGNMNYYQDGKTLYISGGYAYSDSQQDHITFPYLTSVSVPDLIKAVINGTSAASYFKQIKDTVFAVTGGQMGKIGNTFYLAGGQRFDGRYNPMGHPTYSQTYSDCIRKFRIDNSGSQLRYSDYQIITDQVHLHRRDFNLIPQIFPDGSNGYLISSGVFQPKANLPYLYPVEITAAGYKPVTSFNQYLSNYHTAKASLYDRKHRQMNTIFFGGMSQFYYKDNQLINDRNVPYVKTISRLSRYADGSLREFALQNEMPVFAGSNGEFIPGKNIPLYSDGIIDISKIKDDSILIGHIFGGIVSNELNPFTNNNIDASSASNVIYEVRLIRNNSVQSRETDGINPFSVNAITVESSGKLTAEIIIPYDGAAELSVTDKSGIIQFQKIYKNLNKGKQTIELSDRKLFYKGEYSFNFLFDNKYADIKKIFI